MLIALLLLLLGMTGLGVVGYRQLVGRLVAMTHELQTTLERVREDIVKAVTAVIVMDEYVEPPVLPANDSREHEVLFENLHGAVERLIQRMDAPTTTLPSATVSPTVATPAPVNGPVTVILMDADRTEERGTLTLPPRLRKPVLVHDQARYRCVGQDAEHRWIYVLDAA